MDQDKKAELLKALANPHRLTLLERLTACCAPGTICEMDEAASAFVGELGRDLGIAPSTLSHHLKELARAGLIRTRKRGKNVACWIDPETLAGLAEYFAGLAGLGGATKGEVMARKPEEIRKATRDKYGAVADLGGACAPGCCGGGSPGPQDLSSLLGYSPEELQSAPEGSNLGLGCGNPQAIADLRPGEAVLDLGSGGGFDCFLAARQVGPAGRVIGVDMTPEMLAKARENADKSGYANVEFRLGEIESLPVGDAQVDVIMSNCVINLSADKPAVYREAFRVLRPGGRLAISDVVATRPLPEEIRSDLALWTACAAGAEEVDGLARILAEAGFTQIRITPHEASRGFIDQWFPDKGLGRYLVSASIEAVKPGKAGEE
ncbi:MAG: arsenite methyltransferase [Thermodesulfobacteriota bacterium]